MGERRREQVIEQRRILRQHRAVEVGADRVAIDRALGPVRAIVAEAMLNAGERRCGRTQVGAACVVLEADHLTDRTDHRPGDDISDATRRLRPRSNRGDIEDFDACNDFAVLIAVPAAKELETATDRQDRRIRFHPLAKLRTVCGQFVSDPMLLAILPAADQDQVRVRRELIAQAHLEHLNRDPALGGAIADRDQIAAIRIDVHHVGVERHDPQGKLWRMVHRARSSLGVSQ